jgi:hypothetical protein
VTDFKLEFEVVKEIAESHENHFAMVENFVEKFVPVRIQGQISETITELFQGNEKLIERLQEYEKDKMMEFH